MLLKICAFKIRSAHYVLHILTNFYLPKFAFHFYSTPPTSLQNNNFFFHLQFLAYELYLSYQEQVNRYFHVQQTNSNGKMIHIILEQRSITWKHDLIKMKQLNSLT